MGLRDVVTDIIYPLMFSVERAVVDCTVPKQVLPTCINSRISTLRFVVWGRGEPDIVPGWYNSWVRCEFLCKGVTTLLLAKMIPVFTRDHE